MAITVIPSFLGLHRFSGSAVLGTWILFSGTSSTHCCSEKAGRGALGSNPGDVRRAERRFGGRRGRPEGFRQNSSTSDARLVAKGGGVGGCGAWRPRMPSSSASSVGLSFQPDRPAGGYGARGGRKRRSWREGRWEPSLSLSRSRLPGRRGERVPLAGLALGGVTSSLG